MKRTIKLQITIEHDIAIGLHSSFEISDMLFTDFDNLLYYDNIKENLDTALKMSKGFSMLTIDLYDYDSNSFYAQKNVITGKRYLCKNGEITKATLTNGNTYEFWNPSTKKDIFESLKDMVDAANRKYIALIKDAA